ncbi:DUF2752 domain-containing protein [Actinoplanes sp. NPDC051346]|uniref:DUF2752 domain-containing protein n=1 Tax=Actinoplanes sp. NPDC051346 TaxID=3155048 RepID=UPI00342C3BDD
MSSATEPAAPWQPDAPHLASEQGTQLPTQGNAQPWAGYPPYQEPRQDRFTRFLVRKWHTSPLWVAPVATLVCMAGAVGYTFATHPTEANAGAPPSCLLKYTTGFDCPGCGGTRAAWFLLNGDLPAAARHHLLFVFAVPFLLYMYVAWAGKRLFDWRLPQLTLSPVVIGVFVAAWGVFSVLRNLPWAPFADFYV